MLDQAYELLRKHDVRITSQRKAILQVLYNCKGQHLETENIYQLVSINGDKKSKLGLATVYRTMEILEKIGLVSRLSMDGSPAKYELVLLEKMNHHHLICLKCSLVQEIDDSLIEELKSHVIEEKDFLVKDKPIKIYGYCDRCRNQ